jgi:hypothetical protein
MNRSNKELVTEEIKPGLRRCTRVDEGRYGGQLGTAKGGRDGERLGA